MVRWASLCAALLSLCSLSPRQEGQENAYPAFICCSYCNKVSEKKFVPVLITEKNTAEPVRTILTCLDERITTVLKQQSLLRTGIIEELRQSALFMVNIFNLGPIPEQQMSSEFQNGWKKGWDLLNKIIHLSADNLYAACVCLYACIIVLKF